MSLYQDAAEVEEITYQMKLADWSRSRNRALVDSLMNGDAPYSEQQAQEMNLSCNYNDLSAPRMAHDARRQFTSAFQKPANFFKVTLDTGPIHKRGERSTVITKQLNKRLKKSLPYFETLRSTFANVVLHGIGPVVWHDKERWCPKAKGVEDIMIPGNTTLDLDNLPLFAVFEPYTAMQLRKLTNGPNVDPAWNMSMVNKLIEQANKEVLDFGIPNSEIMSPEKQVERLYMDGGIFAADSISTIDTWSFYFWNDEGKEAGWNKRVILDADWAMGSGGVPTNYGKDLKTKAGTRGEFLFNPGKRQYASKISELIHFQFGDLSAVAPFHYHSVRSLGYLLYAVCHLQNRLRCKFMDSVFEQLMQYYRVKSQDEMERALKINLIDKGFIDDTVQFIPPQERWQINQALAEMALQQNDSIIGQNAAIYRSETDYGAGKEKTATQVMAEVNASTALVGAALQQAYQYQEFQYQEIARRFTIKNSKDLDVREFRNACLKRGVPENVLNDVNAWEVTSERVMGGGNKTQEMALAQQLMQWRPMFDPQPQREVLYSAVLAFTDDADMAQRLVPDDPNRVSNSKHDAQLSAAALLLGLHVDLQTGQNHIEIVEALLHEFALVVQKIEQSGGMATKDQIAGFSNMAQYIGQQIQIIAQNPEEKQRVKQYGDDLGKLMNLVKAYAQRLAEQQKKAAQTNGQQVDPKDIVKVKGMQLINQAKAANTRESHAQRTAQRQTQFELKAQQETQKHAQDLAFEAQKATLDIAKETVKHRNKMKSLKE